MWGFSAVDVGIDVSPQRIGVGEVAWRRGHALGARRSAVLERASGARNAGPTTEEVAWVQSVLTAWRCRPASIALTVADAQVGSACLQVPAWLHGEDLVQVIRDDLHSHVGLDLDQVALDFCGVQTRVSEPSLPAGNASEGYQWIDAYWIPVSVVEAQVLAWRSIGVPVGRVEPQSVALARGLQQLSSASTILCVDVQAFGVLCVWVGSGGHLERMWFSSEERVTGAPSMSNAVAPGLIDLGESSPHGLLSDVEQRVAHWLDGVQGDEVAWWLRGQSALASDIRTTLSRLMHEMPTASEYLAPLPTQAWDPATAAWGVAWTREV
jgi:hypothetical protein